MCGAAMTIGDDPQHLDTKWSLVFKFNAIIYMVLTALVVCSCAGLVYSNIMQATLSCLQLAGLAHIAGVILSGVYRFNSSGIICAGNVEKYDEAKNTFEGDGLMLRKLFIAQACILIPFCMCAFIGITSGKKRKADVDDDYLRDE